LPSRSPKTLGLADNGSVSAGDGGTGTGSGSASSAGSGRGSSPALDADPLPLSAEVAALGARLDGVRDVLDGLRLAADNVADDRWPLDSTQPPGSVHEVTRLVLVSQRASQFNIEPFEP